MTGRCNKAFYFCLISLAILHTGCIEETSNVATKSKITPSSPPNIQGMSFSVGQKPNSGDSSNASGTSGSFRPAARPSRGIGWNQYRGHLGRSMTSDSSLPITWGHNENVLWRTELKGRGTSSPVIYQNKVFLTASSRINTTESNAGDANNLTHHVICIDCTTGKYLWIRDIQVPSSPQKQHEGGQQQRFSASTPVVDENRVYTFFGAAGVFAFDHSGTLDWQADVGSQTDGYNKSASLILHNNLLIVNASVESESIYAIDKYTGIGAWKIDGIEKSYSTPVLGVTTKGDRELIILEKDFVRAYDPDSGKEIWFCEGIHDEVASTPFVKMGVCFCNGGVPNQMMAIKIGGRGDVTDSHKLWEVPQGARVASPIYLSGQIYLLGDNGRMQCFDSRDGSLISQTQLATEATTYASPLFSSNLLYIPTEDKGVFVCEATSDLETISHNTIDGDDNLLEASFAASGRLLFLRNDQYIYCIGATEDLPIEVQLKAFQSSGDLIQTRSRYESKTIDAEQKYTFRLTDQPEKIATSLIAPFKAILSDKQELLAKEIISQKSMQFAELLKQHRNAYWEFLQSGSHNDDELLSELKRIERESYKLGTKIHLEIKQKVLTQQQRESLSD